MSTIKRYAGAEITVAYDVARCIHAAECVHGLPAVFDPNGKPWIQPANAAAQALADTVARCPTGALQVQRNDGRPAEAVPATNEATLCAGGPVYLRGDIEVRDRSGNLVARETRMALCRCGASANKPYCDRSHERVGFADPGDFSAEVEFAGPADGALVVVANPNGPLHIQGKLALRRADGSLAAAAAQCWLCRCGSSANKPFCDGTHKKIGFQG